MNPIIPENSARVFTIGHSNRSLPDFLELVREFRLDGIVDVRRYPQSRRHPQFESGRLAEAVGHMGEPAFRGYAEHMASLEFDVALGHLQRRALEARLAVMCAEALPTQCHRNLLADALVRDGFQVTHILAPGKTADHTLSSRVRLDGRTLIYDVGVFSFPG